MSPTKLSPYCWNLLCLNRKVWKITTLGLRKDRGFDDKKDKKRHEPTSNKSYAKVKFEGGCDDLIGFIYDC